MAALSFDDRFPIQMFFRQLIPPLLSAIEICTRSCYAVLLQSFWGDSRELGSLSGSISDFVVAINALIFWLRDGPVATAALKYSRFVRLSSTIHPVC